MKADIPNIGQNAPDFKARTSEDGLFQLHNALETGKNVCLVFYRGHW